MFLVIASRYYLFYYKEEYNYLPSLSSETRKEESHLLSSRYEYINLPHPYRGIFLISSSSISQFKVISGARSGSSGYTILNTESQCHTQPHTVHILFAEKGKSEPLEAKRKDAFEASIREASPHKPKDTIDNTRAQVQPRSDLQSTRKCEVGCGGNRNIIINISFVIGHRSKPSELPLQEHATSPTFVSTIDQTNHYHTTTATMSVHKRTPYIIMGLRPGNSVVLVISRAKYLPRMAADPNFDYDTAQAAFEPIIRATSRNEILKNIPDIPRYVPMTAAD
ncbi:hypothetical protein WAI453_000723 [Rhynchosporium graminicola]